VFFVSFLGIFSDPEGEGILGIFFFVGELGLVVWVLAASIVMLRAVPARNAKP
jgi:threonine/homoserine/homoserine lactone efflux protein